MSASVSGWAMKNRRTVIIPDVFADARVPHDTYRATFVKSLVVVPVRAADPIGAIGTYWATNRHPTDEELRLLEALAGTTAVALENVRLIDGLEHLVRRRTAELEEANRRLTAANAELTAAQKQADRVFAAYAKVLPGTVLDGKYRLDEELGAGGFGVVFRGRHLTLDCPVAVKVFRPVAGNDSGLDLQRFLREGATAARITHPNAVRVLDSGVSSGGVAFLAMELLRGRSLARELAAVGPLSLRRAATVAATVAEVLALAHRQGIVHRDIKPDNVFLHRDECGREAVKVVDFGIAKFAGPTTADSLTRVGEFLGTPRFIAPERVRGAADDGRADVYSLGAVLYEAVCGASPWAPEQERHLAAGLVPDAGPRPMGRFRRGVPADLERLVQRALALDPAARPTAQEVADALAARAPTLDDTHPRLPPTVQFDPDETAPLPGQKWPGG
jgi:serine/threonine protein kinase